MAGVSAAKKSNGFDLASRDAQKFGSLVDKIERGHQAKSLLESPIFKEVLDGLDAEYHVKWRAAKTVEAREDLWRYVKVLERITQDLTSIATTGELERRRQEELKGEKRGIIQWPMRA